MIKLIYINDKWLPVENIDDVSTIIRKYYNTELADQMDRLIPEHTDEEYDELEYKLTHKGDVINIMQEEIFQLNYKIEKLEAQLSETNDKIFELEI
mgnify:CR=1 FL=1